jgi:transcriptional regulator with XRE-family HTH domain
MLGQELRKAREAAGLTQEELAHRAQVDRTYISMLENNRKSPTIDLLLRLCAAMNTSAATIIRRVEQQH